MITNLDIAEIYEALGDHERAAFYRWLHETYGDPIEWEEEW